MSTPPGKRKVSRSVSPNNKDNKVNNSTTEQSNNLNWRESFEVYYAECMSAYQELLSDPNYISEREQYHPNLNIKLSLRKAAVDYWLMEEGWEHKKSNKDTKKINWKLTFSNSLTQKCNQVWKPRDQQKPIDVFTGVETVTTPKSESFTLGEY